MRITIHFLGLFIILLCLSCCGPSGTKEKDEEPIKELLIYSGMTIVSPVIELTALFEQQEKCRVKLSYGGSLHIENSIKVNKIGDLYLPGDESFISGFVETKTVIETKEVGYVQAAIIVRKGNPKQFSNDLFQFADSRFAVVIGAENGGAIGRETKHIFDDLGIYDDVVANAIYLSTDSKGLAQAIRNQDADVTINYKSVAYLPENMAAMDVIDLDDRYARKRKLFLGLLKYSQNKDLGRKFLDLAVSEQGKDIFRRYRLLD